MITPLPGMTSIIEAALEHRREPQRLKRFRAYDTGEFFFNPSLKGEAYHWVMRTLDPRKPMRPLWVRTYPDAMLPAHVDERKRLCAINIPIVGDWDRSKILAYPDGTVEGEVLTYTFGPPVLLDTARLHSVDNRGCGERIILSIGFYKTDYQETLALIKRGELFGKYPFDVTQPLTD